MNDQRKGSEMGRVRGLRRVGGWIVGGLLVAAATVAGIPSTEVEVIPTDGHPREVGPAAVDLLRRDSAGSLALGPHGGVLTDAALAAFLEHCRTEVETRLERLGRHELTLLVQSHLDRLWDALWCGQPPAPAILGELTSSEDVAVVEEALGWDDADDVAWTCAFALGLAGRSGVSRAGTRWMLSCRLRRVELLESLWQACGDRVQVKALVLLYSGQRTDLGARQRIDRLAAGDPPGQAAAYLSKCFDLDSSTTSPGLAPWVDGLLQSADSSSRWIASLVLLSKGTGDRRAIEVVRERLRRPTEDRWWKLHVYDALFDRRGLLPSYLCDEWASLLKDVTELDPGFERFPMRWELPCWLAAAAILQTLPDRRPCHVVDAVDLTQHPEAVAASELVRSAFYGRDDMEQRTVAALLSHGPDVRLAGVEAARIAVNARPRTTERLWRTIATMISSPSWIDRFGVMFEQLGVDAQVEVASILGRTGATGRRNVLSGLYEYQASVSSGGALEARLVTLHAADPSAEVRVLARKLLDRK